MQQERDLQRRALLYRFPQQFAAIGEVLGGFLNAVFEPTRYEQAALLRGVYFTSGTQEGSPIDRVMGALAAAFGLDRKVLPPNAVSGRSYFITALLRELMFKEAGLAGTDRRFEQRRRQLRWLAGGAGGAAAGAARRRPGHQLRAQPALRGRCRGAQRAARPAGAGGAGTAAACSACCRC